VNCCVYVLITTAARDGDKVTAALAAGEAKPMMQPRVKKERTESRRAPRTCLPQEDGTQNRELLCSAPKSTLYFAGG
jgi:hypothetical protein